MKGGVERELRCLRERAVCFWAMGALGWLPAELLVVHGFAARFLGMAVHAPRTGADALPLVMAFPRCASVHTVFMRHALDIAFITAEGRIIAVHERVGPGSLCSCTGACYALERFSKGVAGVS